MKNNDKNAKKDIKRKDASLDMSSVLNREKFFDINEIKRSIDQPEADSLTKTYEKEDRKIEKIAAPAAESRERDGRSLHYLKVLLYILFIAVSSGLLSYTVITFANDMLALAKPDKDITVTIPEGAGTSEIAKILKDEGVISRPLAFRLYSKYKKNDGKYLPGQYELNSSMDYSQIMSILTTQKKDRETVKFTIYEGYDLKQIVKTLVNLGLGKEEKYWEVIEKGEFDYPFIKDLPKGKTRLEGFLFPDTYEVYADESEESIIRRMLANFNKKFTDEYYARAKELGMSVKQVITLASIIEKEGADSEEFPVVSSVFHNRLNHPADFPYLQSCATVQYILPERKAVLTYDDIKIDNPYNTYKYKGLPPGPISNPGLAAIKAALYPAKTDYYYFVVSDSKSHIFSKTFAEHQKAIKQSGNRSQGVGTVTE